MRCFQTHESMNETKMNWPIAKKLLLEKFKQNMHHKSVAHSGLHSFNAYKIEAVVFNLFIKNIKNIFDRQYKC